MKLRVEHITLKELITEATYQDAFSKIKKGDTMVVKTGKQVYSARIINKFGNQVTFEWEGEYYVFTNNSFDGANLTTHRLVIGDDGRTKRTIKGPTINGVYSIVIKRGDEIVSGVSPSQGRPEPQAKTQSKVHTDFEERKTEIINSFKGFTEGEVMEIKTGKLIASGKDKDSIAKNTITSITLHVEKVTDTLLKASPIDFVGADASHYQHLDNSYFYFGPESIEVTTEGINLVIKLKDVDSGKISKEYIKNVFSIENMGQYRNEPEFSVSDIMQSPAMRNMMFKNPSLLDRILGRNKAKGIIPLEKKLASLGLSSKVQKGKNVKFSYEGTDIRPEYRFNFTNGKTYIGKFTKDKVIKRTADNRRESMYIKLGNKLDDKTYEATIEFVKLINNEPQREVVGRGKIKLIDLG